MTNLKATIAIFIWSGAVGYGLWWLRVQDHIPSGSMWGLEPTWVSVSWSVGTALALIIALMVNVWLFSRIASSSWQWFK